MLSTTLDTARPTAPTTTLGDILDGGAVRAVYQPIVALDDGRVVAYEALARGPEGTALERPDALFAEARRSRRLGDLDWACRGAAFRGALDGGLTPPWRLFVNAEPEVLDAVHPPEFDEVVRRARTELSVVVELTERALTARPAELLRMVERVREAGWGIALDDVGAERQSLALMPLLRPDVIKLDLRLVQRRPSADIAEIVTAVNAQAERTGAVVLAEGIETEEHLEVARSMGATLGQGWRFGRPGPLPVVPPAPRPAPRRRTPEELPARDRTPFEVAAAHRDVRQGTKPLLIEISKHLERQAGSLGETAVVLAAFQHARHFTPATRRRYTALAARAAFVGAFGGDMPLEPAPGVRGGVLADDDPLLQEWNVSVIGPHFAAAFCARDLGDTGPDAERRFDFVLTYDRDEAIAVANSLMSRIWADSTVPAVPAAPAPRTLGGPAALGTGWAGPSHRSGLQSVGRSLEQRALDATVNGVTIADMRRADHPLIYVNAAFERLSGYSADEVLGRNCRLLQGPETDPATVAEMAEAIHDGRDCWVSLVNYRKDGTPWWNEIHLAPVHDDHGALTHYIGVQSDVTARVEAQERVRHLAYHDSLTGLANRRSVQEHMGRVVEDRSRDGAGVALLFLDLDDFKAVNDRFGHAVGDQLLRHVAGRLRSVVRSSDLLARQGGDEFLLLLTDLPEDPAAVAERVAWQAVAALGAPFEVAGQRVRVGASVGLALGMADSTDPEHLFRLADAAMYRAKAAGGDRVSH